MARLFGTDGIRGIANTELTPEFAMEIGKATVSVLTKGSSSKARILVGKDTRISSDMLESALAAGMCSMGADVYMLGFIPTPAVAHLIKRYGATAGVVISASHNPMEYNGIKVLGPQGIKLADELEQEIEVCLTNKELLPVKTGPEVGAISYLSNAANEYIEYIADCIGEPLTGIKVAVDCANGASFDVAKKLFTRLEVDAVFTAITPDGTNINDEVGSTHLNSVRNLLLENSCDIGVAFDGDADRCLAVDEKGETIDGDSIIGVFAKSLKEKGKLNDNTVVVTVMSNLGFFEYCRNNGISVARTNVGDRFVLEEMLKNNYSLGGEQSGHIIISEYASTGDGLLTSLMLVKRLRESGLKASELVSEIPSYPQVLKKVDANANQKRFFEESTEIAEFLEEIERNLADRGRILVRCSGTEHLIRVMVEGKNPTEIEETADSICLMLDQALLSVN